MSLLFDGFLKIQKVLFGKKEFEVVRSKDSVCTVIVQQQTDPLHDRITFGTQFRVGPYAREYAESSLGLCAGYVEPGEPPYAAAAREAVEEFGAHGFIHHLKSFYVAPGTTTEVSHMHWLEVKEWTEPTDKTEGIEKMTLTLEEMLVWLEKPGTPLSLQMCMAIKLYAKLRGING